MLKGSRPSYLSCSTLAPGFAEASIWLRPPPRNVVNLLVTIHEFHVFRFHTPALPPRKNESVSAIMALTTLAPRKHTAGARWKIRRHWESLLHAKHVWRGTE
jgi:hypothetical protein